MLSGCYLFWQERAPSQRRKVRKGDKLPTPAQLPPQLPPAQLATTATSGKRRVLFASGEDEAFREASDSFVESGKLSAERRGRLYAR